MLAWVTFHALRKGLNWLKHLKDLIDDSPIVATEGLEKIALVIRFSKSSSD
jgi:hypothetical protein